MTSRTALARAALPPTLAEPLDAWVEHLVAGRSFSHLGS
jgi:integrase/recombinase XerC